MGQVEAAASGQQKLASGGGHLVIKGDLRADMGFGECFCGD